MQRWDQKYGTSGYFYGTEPNDFLRENAGLISAGGRVLCLGEGEGRNGVFLAGLGLSVLAVDQSGVGLEKAQRLADSRGVTLATVRADLADYRIEPADWDGIVSIWCHLPKPLRASVHRQVVAGLRPGGVLVFEAYTPDQLRQATGGPRERELLPTLAELRAELAGLDLLRAAELERIVLEGQGHRGMSSVVQIVARRD